MATSLNRKKIQCKKFHCKKFSLDASNDENFLQWIIFMWIFSTMNFSQTTVCWKLCFIHKSELSSTNSTHVQMYVSFLPSYLLLDKSCIYVATYVYLHFCCHTGNMHMNISAYVYDSYGLSIAKRFWIDYNSWVVSEWCWWLSW